MSTAPAPRRRLRRPPTPAGDDPSGRPRTETVATGLEAPWELAFLPDGRALVTERPGRVRLLSKDLKLRERPVAEIDVAQIGEGGLLGLAVDPQFERNSFVYLYRTTDSGNEVLRYRFEGGRLEEDARILDGLQAAPIHDGGRLRFGPDGLLYVTTGEAGNPALAQDDDSLNGKLLRLRGFRGERADAEIVSKGHRNVQGLDWEPSTERLVITEFGPDSDDEVNVIERRGNYGWPDAQGRRGRAGVRGAGGELRGRDRAVGRHVRARRRLRLDRELRVRRAGGRAATADRAQRRPRDGERGAVRGRFGRFRTVTEGPDGALYALTNNPDGRGSPRDDDDRVLRIIPPRN